mmetsp:Transcript_17526/g.26658  ORF Transcript_17526/g.26658 Transcript_17526/m.26658 type:complete len:83 (+) Transcript_17526:171-419(+)
MKIIWLECLCRQLQQTCVCLCSSSGVIMSLAVMSDIHWDLPATIFVCGTQQYFMSIHILFWMDLIQITVQMGEYSMSPTFDT